MFQEMSEQRARPTPVPRKSQKFFSIIHISPTSVVYNKHETVILVFSQSLPSNVEFTVRFTGLQTEQTCDVKAEKIGDNVLRFQAPDYYPPEDTKLSVHHGTHLTMLCSHQPFRFISYLEQIRETLLRIDDPIEFMCAALNLRKKNTVALDIELEKQFKKNLPPNFDLLAMDKRERVDEVQIQMTNPTLLHFAARYNLVKLAVAILACPGGQKALNMKNVDDLTPNEIANQCGHEQLGFVLADAQQHPNMFIEAEDVYLSMHDPILYETYVSIMRNSNDDDIYVPMDQADELIYEEMDHHDENIYQNPTSMQNSANGSNSLEYRDTRRPVSQQPYMSMHNEAADNRSVYSFSSTSSSESSVSSGSGTENFSSRPAMPTPRHQRSYDERDFRDKYQIQRKGHSLPPGAQRQYRRSAEENKYATTPRRTSQPVLPALPSDAPYHEDVPPPPPARNPNVNY